MKAAEVVQFVELVPETEPALRCAGFVVRSGDFEVEVGSDFDEAALIRLLRLVRAC